jgi:hypothetical protein
MSESKYHILIDGKNYISSELTENELKFFKKKNLIKINGDLFKTNFVGEIITPDKNYFSVPKNFEANEKNINLFKEVLNKYSKINGKSLLENNTFIISDDGELESEKFLDLL